MNRTGEPVPFCRMDEVERATTYLERSGTV